MSSSGFEIVMPFHVFSTNASNAANCSAPEYQGLF